MNRCPGNVFTEPLRNSGGLFWLHNSGINRNNPMIVTCREDEDVTFLRNVGL
jgi:hypothetical protein